MPRTVNEENIAKRKEQIIQAAISAFSRSGIKDTSMDQIVEESKTSKGLVYWYFKNKDELIQAVFKSFFEGIFGTKEIMESSASATERMNRFTDVTVSEITRVFRFRPIIQELYVLAFRNKMIKRLAKKEFDTYFNLLKTIIQDGIKNKEFRKVNPEETASAILAAIEGTSLLFFMGVMEADVGEQTKVGINLILDSIKVNR